MEWSFGGEDVRQLNRLAKSTGAFWSKPTFVIFSIFLFYNYVVPFSFSLAGLNVPSSHVAARGGSSRILLRSLSPKIVVVVVGDDNRVQSHVRTNKEK